MKKQTHKLTEVIVDRLRSLAKRGVPRVSTMKLLAGLPAFSLSPASVWRAVAAVRVPGWEKMDRTFYRIPKEAR